MSTKAGMKSMLIKANDSTSEQFEDKRWGNESLAGQIVEPKYSFSSLIDIYELNTIANKSIEIIAKKVWYGWYEVVEDKTGKLEWEKLEKQIEIGQDFINKINPDKNFWEIIHDLVIDLEITWNAWLEISRVLWVWDPLHVYNVPIDTLRKLQGEVWVYRTGQRFVQVFDNMWKDYVYYNNYTALKENRNEDNWYSTELNKDGKTNEIMFFTLPNPADRNYWLSPSVTLLKPYLLKKYIQDTNIWEFENGFLAKLALVIKWGHLTDDSITALKTYLNEGTHKNSIPIVHSPTGDVKFEKLWDSVRDWSYLELMKTVDDEVIIAFWVPPIMLGIVENSTQANQLAQEKKFHNEEVKPLAEMIAKRFTRMLQEDLWLTWIKLVPKVPDFKDIKEEMEIADKGLANWTLSINESRARLGQQPLTDEAGNPLEWAETNYVKVWNTIIPVNDLWEYTGDTAKIEDLEKVLKTLDTVWNNLQKGVEIKNEESKVSIDY